jgi:hypothetical protein
MKTSRSSIHLALNNIPYGLLEVNEVAGRRNSSISRLRRGSGSMQGGVSGSAADRAVWMTKRVALRAALQHEFDPAGGMPRLTHPRTAQKPSVKRPVLDFALR